MQWIRCVGANKPLEDNSGSDISFLDKLGEEDLNHDNGRTRWYNRYERKYGIMAIVKYKRYYMLMKRISNTPFINAFLMYQFEFV